jgi:hypothetical protein
MRTERPLRLGSCDRGTPDSRPTLYVREAPQASVLAMTIDGVECQVIVQPRYVRCLLLLVDGWNQDADEPDAVRGFRTAAEIARGFGRFLGSHGSVDVATIVQYVYEFRLFLNKVTPSTGTSADAEPIELIEHRRGFGYRIGPRGLVVRGAARRSSDPE